VIEEGQESRLLFAHKTDEPGASKGHRNASGPLGEGEAPPQNHRGQGSLFPPQAGVLKTLSVGFQVPPDSFAHKVNVPVITRAVLEKIR
jgi:hypothetical protein